MSNEVEKTSFIKNLWGNYIWKVLCVFLIVFFGLVFVQKGVIQSIGEFKEYPSNGRDLRYFRAGGSLWADGKNPHDPVDMEEYWSKESEAIKRVSPENFMYYYPPQASLLFSWLAKLSYPTAYWFFLSLNLLLTLTVLGLLAYIISWRLSLGLLEFTLLASLLHVGVINVRRDKMAK